MTTRIQPKPSSRHVFAYAVAMIVLTGSGQFNVHGGTTLSLGFSPPSTLNESNSAAYLDFIGDPNKIYKVRSATDLSQPNPWTVEDTVKSTNSTTGPIRWMAPEAMRQQKYYQLILPQMQIFSVEPAVVEPGVAQAFDVSGQCFDSNTVLSINGVVVSNAVLSSSTLISVPSFTPDVAGSYQFAVSSAGQLQATYNVLAVGASLHPEQVFQGPPDQPLASPETSSIIAFWLGKKGYDYYKSKSDLTAAGATSNPYFTANEMAGSMPTRPRSAARKNGTFTSGDFNSPPRMTGGGSVDTLLMPALMKAKEKANQSKCMALGVKPFSGEVQECDVDLYIPGRSLDFVWARIYRSRVGTNTTMGQHWTHSYDVHAEQSAAGITVSDGTGCRHLYVLGGNGAYTCDEMFNQGGVSNNTFTLTFADTGRWVFNPFDGSVKSGKLLQIISRTGDAMTLSYDTSGRLSTIVDDLGRTNTVAYNTSGYVASVSDRDLDFNDQTVTYNYYTGAKSDNGGAGDLMSVTSPPVTGTPNGNDFPSGKTTTYTYSKSFPIAVDQENHLLLTVTDPKGQTAAVFFYEHSSTSPNYLRCISAQDGTNTPTTFSYYSHQIHQSQYPGTDIRDCIVNDPVGNVSVSSFDARNRLLRLRQYTGRAVPGVAVTTNSNLPTGQLRSSDPAYYDTTCAWNNDSLCTKMTFPAGDAIECVYQRDLDSSLGARKNGDLRVWRQIACCDGGDVDGDGYSDTTVLTTTFQYDPHFGSPCSPGVCCMAINSKGLPGPKNRSDGSASARLLPTVNKKNGGSASSGQKLVAVKTMSWAHDDEAPKESILWGPGGGGGGGGGGGASDFLAFTFKLVAVKTISWSHDDEAPKETVTFEHGECHSPLLWGPGGGGSVASATLLPFTFKLVAVKTCSMTAPNHGLLWGPGGGGEDMPTESASLPRKGWDGTIKGVRMSSSQPKIVDNNKGMVLFEDMWPMNGDLDFNDFCISSTDPRGFTVTAAYDSQGNCRNIGSQSSGAGAGKVTFNPFSITRKINTTAGEECDFAYNSHGQLVAITNSPDANGHRRVDTCSYYASGTNVGCMQSCVVDAGGLALTESYQYDGHGNVVRCVDPRTNDWLFTYNSLNQCVKKSSSSLQSSGSLSTFRVSTQYTYDADDNLTMVSTDNLDSTGTPGTTATWNTQFAYDQENRLVSITSPPISGATTATTTFAYDAANECVQVSSPEAVAGHDTSNVIQYQYDERKDMLQWIRAVGTSVQESVVADYDLDGRLAHMSSTSDTCGAGGCLQTDLSLAYDGFGRCISATDALGNVASCAYDRNNNLIYARIDGETNDVAGAAHNVRLAECRCVYDDFNRCVLSGETYFDPATQSPIGGGVAVTSCTYAPNGRCVSVTDALGNTGTCSYDTACRLSGMSDSRGDTLAITRDADGDPVSITETDLSDLGGSTSFSIACIHDSLGRPTQFVDSANNTNRYAYDSRGNCTSEIDPLGHLTVSTYDGLCRSTAKGHYSDMSGGPSLRTTSCTYDNNSRLVSSTDANSNVTVYSYDSADNLVSITNADGSYRAFIWSPRSNLIVEQDENGTTITNHYDACDKIVHRDIAARNVLATTTSETFAYDGACRLVLASNDVSSSRFSYDSMGNTIRCSQDGLSQSATYDVDGDCLSRTYPGGAVTTYAYDVLNRVTNISATVSGVFHPHLVGCAYDGPDRPSQITRDNGTITRLNYDGLSSTPNGSGDFGFLQVKGVSHQNTAGTVVIDRRIAKFDRDQNRTQRSQTVPFFNNGPMTTNTFSYDPLDQLAHAINTKGTGGNTGFTDYVFDPEGNRQFVTNNGVVGTYTMNNASVGSGDSSMNQYSSTPFGSQSYDADGDLTFLSTALSPYLYQYDYARRLVSVSGISGGAFGTVVSFSYDALGRRVSKTTYPPSPASPVTTVYVCGGGDGETDKDCGGTSYLEERSGGTTPTRVYCGDASCITRKIDCASTRFFGMSCVAFPSSGSPQYYHCDDLGNTLALTDSSGNVLERYDYGDYGAPQFLTSDGSTVAGATASSVGNSYLFRGMQWDGETSLYYAKKHISNVKYNDIKTQSSSVYLDPATGRFITRDCASGACNGRVFSGNNPWSFGGGGNPTPFSDIRGINGKGTVSILR